MFNKQTIVYTLTDPENEAFKQVRRMNNVAADAKDEQLVAIRQAFQALSKRCFDEHCLAAKRESQPKRRDNQIENADF